MAGGGKKFVIEPNSPYFLHLSEELGMSITTVIIDGKNYDLWEKAITKTLLSKSKSGFIYGILQKLW